MTDKSEFCSWNFRESMLRDCSVLETYDGFAHWVGRAQGFSPMQAPKPYGAKAMSRLSANVRS